MSSRSFVFAACTLASLVLAAGGCVKRAARGPADALAGFATALERGDFDRSYALMSSEYRARNSRAEFERYLRSDADRIPTVLATLYAARPEAVRLVATATGAPHDGIRLVDPDGRGDWYLDGGILDIYSQRTPREVLHSFIRALAAERYDVLLRFAPDRYREHMDAVSLRAELEKEAGTRTALLERLRAAIDNDIVVSDDGAAAKMRYGRFEVDFVKEGDLWKIDDPD